MILITKTYRGHIKKNTITKSSHVMKIAIFKTGEKVSNSVANVKSITRHHFQPIKINRLQLNPRYVREMRCFFWLEMNLTFSAFAFDFYRYLESRLKQTYSL